jgi:REP element-mobilizing transposase RayT
MMRGIERRRIFRDDADRRDWVDRMGRLFPAHEVHCFAWALMPNHVHLVLQTGRGGLSRVMARLNTGYARSFNLRHERSGYLFQNRFKSRIVRDDADLLNLIHYVHANPLKARLVRSLAALERYPWSGHGALVGARSPLPFENVNLVLGHFANTQSSARRRLERWMADDLDRPDVEAELGGDPLPGPEDSIDEGDEALEEMIARVCRYLRVSKEDLTSSRKGRGLSQARAVIAFLGVARLGVPGTRVAERTGLSRSGVSRAIDRGADICTRERLG